MNPIEVLSDVIMDECVFIAAAGGKLMRQNDRTSNQGGWARVNAVRDMTLNQYLLGVKPMGVSIDWKEVRAVYEVTEAGAFGFLIKDPIDQSVGFSDGALQGYMAGVESGVPGFGNGGPVYGLRQLYKPASSTRTKAKARTRPNGTPSVRRGGTPVTVGVAAGNIAFSAAPVYVTFVPDATRTVSAVTVGATTQVTLSSAIAGLVNSGKLWLQGLTGADAALLNNLSHTITNIAGAVYTLSTNTAGKTITAAGEGRKYPQPDESLMWAGSFYVPVHFSSDEMNWDLVLAGSFDGRLVSASSVELLEIREA